MGLLLSIPATFVFNVIKKYCFSDTQESEKAGIVLQVNQLLISLLLKTSKLWQVKRVYNVASDPFHEIDKIGLVPLQSDRELDYPTAKLQQTNVVDGISLSGFNQKGDCLIIRIARRHEDKVEIILYLRLSDGNEYKLPNLPDTRAYMSDSQNFSSCGLKIQCLSAMSRWRIAYNGILRKVDKGEEENEVIHVRFSFVWTTVSLVHDFQRDFDCRLLAESLSKDHSLFFYSALYKLKERLDCYEHWGQFSGTVCIGTQEEQEVFLWGPRARNRGILDWKEVKGYQSICGQMKDGTKFHLCSVSMPGIVSRLKYGYIVLPDNFLHYIQFCNYETQSKDEDIPKRISFKAGGKTYIVDYYQSRDGFNAYFGEDWNISSSFRYTTFTLNGFEGKGFVEVGTRNETEKPPSISHLRPSLLREPEIKGTKIPWIVDFTERLCQSSNVSGGKGSSLAMLTMLCTSQNMDNHRFVVPKGVVVTTAAYRYHLSLNQNLSREIASLPSYHNLKEMEQLSKSLMTNFTGTSLTDELKAAILVKLQRVFPDRLSNMTFAVRSSATGEDSDETSAAGQMVTFLGVKTIDQIYENVVKCWSSQFSLTALNYKRQTGQIIDSDMAVVIQEMVPAEVAGVAFTCDPLTCNPENITITANYGLGESVVSAAAEPDTIILKRSVDNNLVLQSETIGKKNVKIYISNEGDTASENVLEEDSKKCCLKREDSLRIGHVSILVEGSFGNPRDIEWAIAGGKLYLLQARPITTCNLETDFEIIHELDSAAISDYEYLTRANVGEVVPRVSCPLSTTGIYRINDLSFQHMYSLQFGKSRWVYHPGFQAIVFFYAGHVFLNILEMMYRQVNKSDNAVTRGWQWALFGKAIENADELRSIALHRYGEFPPLKGFKNLIMTFLGSYYNEKRLDDITKLVINSYLPEDRKFSSSFQLYTIISQMLPLHSKTGLIHIECTGSSSLYNIFVMGIMASSAREIDEKLYSQFSRLLSNCENVESADVPQSMKKLAYTIVLNGAKEKLLNMTPEEATRWLQEEKGQIGAKYREFLRQHGHRGLMEFDLYSHPWRMDPAPLVKTLQSMVKQPSDRTTNKRKDDSLSTVLNEIPLNIVSKFILKTVVKWARNAISQRERSKSTLVRSGDVFRRAYGRLGKMMAEEGRIPEEDLIFFCTHEEIGELLKTRSARIISKAIRRKRMHPKLNSLLFPEISCGPPQLLKDPNITVDNTVSDWVIKATPVSQGKVTAKARIVRKLEEADTIQHGEILVTYSTDIGWTPYFPLLSGVVTEIGGLISHGAVVAREFGVPCIVGAVNASYIVKTGDLVELDGRNGTLKKVSTD